MEFLTNAQTLAQDAADLDNRLDAAIKNVFAAESDAKSKIDSLIAQIENATAQLDVEKSNRFEYEKLMGELMQDLRSWTKNKIVKAFTKGGQQFIAIKSNDHPDMFVRKNRVPYVRFNGAFTLEILFVYGTYNTVSEYKAAIMDLASAIESGATEYTFVSKSFTVKIEGNF